MRASSDSKKRASLTRVEGELMLLWLQRNIVGFVSESRFTIVISGWISKYDFSVFCEAIMCGDRDDQGNRRFR